MYFPVILLRGFAPTGGADRDPFTGYNDGTAYTSAVYESRDFEGFVVNFLKDDARPYRDTINVLRFHPPQTNVVKELGFGYKDSCFSVADPEKLAELKKLAVSSPEDAARSFWVFNYYAAYQGGVWRREGIRTIPYFARELQRFIEVVLSTAFAPDYKGERKVNLIAHSMGGVILRHLIQRRYHDRKLAESKVNRIVTLGSPLTGITYMEHGFIELLRGAFNLGDASELDAMDPQQIEQPLVKATVRESAGKLISDMDALHGRKPELAPRWNDYGLTQQSAIDKFKNREVAARFIDESFDPRRWLCVIGTNSEAYTAGLGRLGEWLRSRGGRTDGLVAQERAYLEGSPKAYLHKPHGGIDGLQTSRESFEVATRFLFGTHDISVTLEKGSRILNFDKNNQYYLGCSIKVRGVDFFLHQMDRDSKNCIIIYSPTRDLAAKYIQHRDAEAKFTSDILLYEGSLDMDRSRLKLLRKAAGGPQANVEKGTRQMAFRFDFNLFGEDQPGLIEAALQFLHLRHSDHIVAQEQFFAIYSEDHGRLFWFPSTKKALGLANDALDSSVKLMSATKPVNSVNFANAFLDELANPVKLLAFSGGTGGVSPGENFSFPYVKEAERQYSIRGLPVIIKDKFEGSLRVDVTLRAQ